MSTLLMSYCNGQLTYSNFERITCILKCLCSIFSDLFLNIYCVGTHFELPLQVEAIQMSTNNICF